MKKLISLIIVLCMVLGLAGVTAAAADITVTAAQEGTITLNGDTLVINCPGEEFTVYGDPAGVNRLKVENAARVTVSGTFASVLSVSADIFIEDSGSLSIVSDDTEEPACISYLHAENAGLLLDSPNQTVSMVDNTDTANLTDWEFRSVTVNSGTLNLNGADIKNTAGVALTVSGGLVESDNEDPAQIMSASDDAIVQSGGTIYLQEYEITSSASGKKALRAVGTAGTEQITVNGKAVYRYDAVSSEDPLDGMEFIYAGSGYFSCEDDSPADASEYDYMMVVNRQGYFNGSSCDLFKGSDGNTYFRYGYPSSYYSADRHVEITDAFDLDGIEAVYETVKIEDASYNEFTLYRDAAGTGYFLNGGKFYEVALSGGVHREYKGDVSLLSKVQVTKVIDGKEYPIYINRYQAELFRTEGRYYSVSEYETAPSGISFMPMIETNENGYPVYESWIDGEKYYKVDADCYLNIADSKVYIVTDSNRLTELTTPETTFSWCIFSAPVSAEKEQATDKGGRINLLSCSIDCSCENAVKVGSGFWMGIDGFSTINEKLHCSQGPVVLLKNGGKLTVQGDAEIYGDTEAVISVRDNSGLYLAGNALISAKATVFERTVSAVQLGDTASFIGFDGTVHAEADGIDTGAVAFGICDNSSAYFNDILIEAEISDKASGSCKAVGIFAQKDAYINGNPDIEVLCLQEDNEQNFNTLAGVWATSYQADKKMTLALGGSIYVQDEKNGDFIFGIIAQGEKTSLSSEANITVSGPASSGLTVGIGLTDVPKADIRKCMISVDGSMTYGIRNTSSVLTIGDTYDGSEGVGIYKSAVNDTPAVLVFSTGNAANTTINKLSAWSHSAGSTGIYADGGTVIINTGKEITSAASYRDDLRVFISADGEGSRAFVADYDTSWAINGGGALFQAETALRVYESTVSANGAGIKPLTGGTFIGELEYLDEHDQELGAGALIPQNYYFREESESGYTYRTVTDAEHELRFALENAREYNDYRLPCDISLNANSGDFWGALEDSDCIVVGTSGNAMSLKGIGKDGGLYKAGEHTLDFNGHRISLSPKYSSQYVLVAVDGGMLNVIDSTGADPETGVAAAEGITAFLEDGGKITINKPNNNPGPSGGGGGGGSAVVKPEEKKEDPAVQPGATPEYSSFSDLDPAAWYKEGIEYCLEKGLMKGLDDGKLFGPKDTALREQVVAMIYRLENEPENKTWNSYSDVVHYKWCAPAIQWATEEGIITGNPGGKFGIGSNITREQLVSMLFRYAKYAGFDISNTDDSLFMTYNDALSTHDYAQEAMKWAINNGIITGNELQYLKPAATATRAELATIFMRFCVKFGK